MKFRIGEIVPGAALAVLLTSGHVMADTLGEALNSEPVVKPEVKRRPFDNQRIADKDWEASLRLGMMNIEGIGGAPVLSLRLARHLSAWHFVEASVGQARPADGHLTDNSGT